MWQQQPGLLFATSQAACKVASRPDGQGGCVYLFSCTAGFGLQWAEASNKPVVLRSKPKFCEC